MRHYAGQKIWIIGASSGIGLALAKELSARGASLILSGRDEPALQTLKQFLGPNASVQQLDVRDAKQIGQVFQKIAESGDVDRVVFMAGAYQPMDIVVMDMAATGDIIATNLLGAMNVVRTVLPSFLARNRGQIALCASVAGYRGLPHAQPYGATKAGLINFAESLYAECRKSDVDIKVINPGFVRTKLTAKNTFSMPMMIEPEDAARAIADGLILQSFEIHFPKPFTWLAKLARLLPASLYFRMVAK